ncbi:L-aspartate oxidase [Methylocystis bryophila]|uniref:L-aspartate oxidase n=1 Tax=Methylocystis bryophila TaxID=655015 RepID=A0A1W6MYS4_9HYPH|nr:L-aspartate oxidase [Methylocystis bryophila]ARN82741.1 L-aspartate oxidase [Methylocystis bryophila]
MKRDESSIIVIGGGLAGLFCALKLAPTPVTVLAPHGVGPASSSFWAQGGIAAAVEETDTPEVHAEDTIRAGAGLVDENMALGMAREARARVEDLLAFGVPFDRGEMGLLAPSREAAHTHRRVVRVQGDGAGRAIMETLAAAAARTESIRIVEGRVARRIVTQGGRAIGVMTRDEKGEASFLPAAALVLATGGIGRLYRVTTNPPESCGEGVAMAAEAGARIADVEFVQFHPTAIDVGEDPAPLATEALRGEGAIIVDRDGRRFLLDIDPLGELAPRDIVARGIFASIARGDGAFLDTREAVGSAFPERFPNVFSRCMAAGLDPRAAPIPIAPAAHYHMGGVWTDARGRTTLPGLWAAGEVASTGVHGANRLASNSLLEAVVFGARIAEDIALSSPPAPEAVDVRCPPRDAAKPQAELIEELRTTMSRDVGVIRDESGLARAIRTILRLKKEAADEGTAAMLTTSLCIACAAYSRRESRGAHFRADFPKSEPAQAKRSLFDLDSILRRAAIFQEDT